MKLGYTTGATEGSGQRIYYTRLHALRGNNYSSTCYTTYNTRSSNPMGTSLHAFPIQLEGNFVVGHEMRSEKLKFSQ